MSWKSIDEPELRWRSLDESPGLPPAAAKASSYLAELVLLGAAVLLAVFAYARSRPAPEVVAAPVEASAPGHAEAPAAPVPDPAPPPGLAEAPAAAAGAKAAPPPPERRKVAETILPEPEAPAIVATPVPAAPVFALPPAPAPSVYLGEWRAAMARAARRDLDGAVALLRKAERKDAELDLLDLERLRALEERALTRLSRAAKGATLELELVGGERIAGELLSAGRERLELRRGEDGIFVETRDLAWSSLAARGDEDPRALALALLLDGRRREAWEAIGQNVDALPARHWHLERSDAPLEIDPVEMEARRVLYAAERAYRSPSTRASAVGRYRALLNEFSETSLVRRSLARITERAKAPEETYFAAGDLRGAGRFQLHPEGWISSGAVDFPKARQSFVEVEFEAEPGVSYRLFVRIGLCCADGGRLYGQASGLEKTHPTRGGQVALEPGSIYALTLRRPHGIEFPTSHAAGHKRIWGWTELPLPAYPKGGTKRARILTERDGLGVSAMLVTASRQGPPTEEERAALEAGRRVE